MTTVEPDAQALGTSPYPAADRRATLFRLIAWVNVALLAVFLVNNFAANFFDLPGGWTVISGDEDGGGAVAWLQLLSYPIGAAVAIFLVARRPRRSLRADELVLTNANAYFIRACFWAVLFVGLGDLFISFMGVEGHTETLLGRDAYLELRKQHFRGPYVHVPLILLGFLVARFSRTLGFHWLALLVVAAELMIVIGRFVFSYEQAFMADLVRYWYAALFLFASAYTLLEDGHVRVDVAYAALRPSTQGRLNAIGALLFGIPLCWVIIIIGMGGQGSVINAPMFNFERGQQDAGLYIKYQLAAFIGIFAISMLVQFCASLLENVADARDEPGRRKHQDSHGVG